MARWGVIEGNPVHDDVRAIAAATGVTFGFDVILNRDQEIVAAYGGDLEAMHERAVRHARQIAMRPVSGPFDVVVTSNSGYPLDQNLYQAVKGMSAAYQVARPGGTIICAAECRDGFPEHGGYRDLLASAPSPRALLEAIETRSATRPDQWQVQIQARIQADCRVVMHTSYLSDSDLAAAHLEQTADISDSVARALAAAAPGGRACVLPEGPQTVPYLV
jgi:nickel-dependent lactate racemase